VTKAGNMKTTQPSIELKSGMILHSPDLNCNHILVTVTDKKVSYTPENGNYGLRANKNLIRIFTTSRRKAELWVNEGSWIIK